MIKLLKYEINLKGKQSKIITTCSYSVTFYYQVMHLKNLEIINYGLCRCHCLSAPSLSWDSMRQMTEIKIDPDMYILYF